MNQSSQVSEQLDILLRGCDSVYTEDELRRLLPSGKVLRARPAMRRAAPAAGSVKGRGAESLARALRDHRDDARLYRTLATLVTDVPLKESLADLEWRGADRQAFTAWCERVGSPELATMPRRWQPS